MQEGKEKKHKHKKEGKDKKHKHKKDNLSSSSSSSSEDDAKKKPADIGPAMPPALLKSSIQGV